MTNTYTEGFAQGIEPQDEVLLPPGVHPGDPRSNYSGERMTAGSHHGGAPRGKAPWSVPNSKALHTFQRLSSDWQTNLIVLSSGLDINDNGVVKVVNALPGRSAVTLWVPAQVPISGSMTTTPAGVMFSSDEGDLIQGYGTPLNVGDSVTVDAEGAIYAGLQPGESSGYVAYMHCFNPSANLQVD